MEKEAKRPRRRVTPWKKTFPLKAAEIDAFSERINEMLLEIRTERQNRLRIRLSIEEALLRMRDHFGQDVEVSAEIGSHFGRPFIQIELEENAYNPLSKTESELEDWNSSLLTAVGLSPRYIYSNGVNILRVSLPHKGLNPVIKILGAVAIGVLIGLIGTLWLPNTAQDFVSEQFLTPVYELWLRILNVISGPVIFLMVITTLLNAEKLSVRGANSHVVMIRYFLLSFAIAAPGAIASAFIFRAAFHAEKLDTNAASGYLNTLLQLIPNEIVTPFMQTNTPQLIVIAVVLGTALNSIGHPARHLSGIIKEANMVGLLLTDWVSRLVPYFMALLIGFEIWEGKTRTFSGIWKTIVLALVVSLMIIAISNWYVSRKKTTPVRLLMKKLRKPFWTALSTGSLDAGYGLTEASCSRDLGIDKEFASLSLPHGLVMFMPISAVGTLVFSVFVANLYNVATTPVWFVEAILIAVVVFVATPPVPGANLIAYTVMFPALGIPSAALIDAMIFDIVFGLFSGAANQLLLQLDMILQAGRIGLLNRKTLSSDTLK